MKTREQLIKAYIDFFKSKNHKEIQNSSLVPKDDPTVLFTTAGMHPLVPYLLGQPHPQGKRLVNVQKCIRTGDINEVGDTTHHTFFEMLGNWSLGDYFKEESIKLSFEFLTKVLKLKKEKLAITFFAGDPNKISADFSSKKIWENLKIPPNKITPLGKEDNWWGPAGKTGPCGPDTEIFYWSSKESVPKEFNPNDSTLATGGKGWIEIWNNVFMEYNKNRKGRFNPSKQKNIDTGMGVERTLAILQGVDDNYLTEIWQPIIKQIEKLSKKKYKGNEREIRIIADHIKAAVFIIADGITPSNTEQGYVLRRLIRRAVRYSKNLGIPKKEDLTTPIVKEILKIYKDYDILKKNKQKIIDELNKEEDQFEKTLEQGLKQLKKISEKTKFDKKISGKDSFLLYQSYGFPIEMTKEIAIIEHGMEIDEKGFQKELASHQKLSRTASAGKFKSGLADSGEQTTKLHTATHILAQALQIVLKKPDLHQKGSNITPERLRFDFNFDRKLTDKEKQEVEDLVNKQIKKKLKVKQEEMTISQAKKAGAQGIFDSKYKEKVHVYTIGDFNKEICAGPHVSNTSELGTFKIKKEQSSSAGVRRIRAILE